MTRHRPHPRSDSRLMSFARSFDLSICIPTYNRIDVLAPLVERLLRDCDDPRVEVVIQDNGSTDPTLAVLRAIDDPRLRVYSNGTNRGVLFNVLTVLDKAQGQFAALLLDKDKIDPARVSDFRRFLTGEPGLTCGFCEFGVDTSPRLFEPGDEAVRSVAYIGHHPTGFFFDMDRLRAIDYIDRFGDFSRVGHFAFEFMFAELLISGRGAIYQRPLFSPESQADAARHKSFGTNAAREDAFFSPPERLRTAVRFARHIGTLPLAAQAKRTLVLDRFIQGLAASTLGYRALLANDALCTHYHISTRRVSLRELLSVAAEFHRSFVREVVDPASGAPLSRVRFNLAVAGRVLQRLGRRSLRLRRAS